MDHIHPAYITNRPIFPKLFLLVSFLKLGVEQQKQYRLTCCLDYQENDQPFSRREQFIAAINIKKLRHKSLRY